MWVMKSQKSVANMGLMPFVTLLTKFLDEHEASIASTAPALTSLDKQRRGKLRLGGEKAVPIVAALVKKYGLESPSLQAETMTANMATAQSLVPVQKRLETLNKRMEDEIFNAHSAGWAATSDGYAQLTRMAKKNGEIATAIAPVQQYFARRSKSTTEQVGGVAPATKAKTGKKAKAEARLEKEATEAQAMVAGEQPAQAQEATAAPTTPVVTPAAAATPQA